MTVATHNISLFRTFAQMHRPGAAFLAGVQRLGYHTYHRMVAAREDRYGNMELGTGFRGVWWA